MKQRLLGGVVLIAGAILLLPYAIENTGTGLPSKPQIPARPTVPAPDDMAPRLEQQQAELGKAVDEAHSDQNFYPVGGPAASGETAVVAPSATVASAAPDAVRASAASAHETAAVVGAAAVAAAALAAHAVSHDQKPASVNAMAAANAERAAVPDQKPMAPPADAHKADADKQKAAEHAAARLADEKAAQQAKADRVAQEEADRKARDAEHKAKAEAEKAAKADAERQAREEAAQKLAAQKAAAQKEADQKEAETRKADAPADAWQIQVASLGSEDKARQLVTKLHKKGYHASVRHVGGSWKVIVGPVLAKDSAEAQRRRMADDGGLKLNGWVQHYRP